MYRNFVYHVGVVKGTKCQEVRITICLPNPETQSGKIGPMVTAYNAYHDRADESWYEEEHPHHSATEEAEHKTDYGEKKIIGSMRMVCDDDRRYSRLRIDHNHVLEGEEGERGETGKQARRQR